MLELVERQSTQATDHREVIATANVGDISPEDVPRAQRSSSGGPEAAQDGVDCGTFFPASGEWPRIFPGL